MRGPVDYLVENQDRVLAALRSKELTPQVFYHSAEDMNEIDPNSVQLVVTSPPYPMIEMWDGLLEKLLHLPRGSFSKQTKAFELSHEFLNRIWAECFRVLDQGGILCVNIGDATRSLAGSFQCYLNHARVAEHCERIGFQSLVPILWRKPTNKPNAFLGTGTTLKTARTLGRRGIGYEVNPSLKPLIDKNVQLSPPNPEDVIEHLRRMYEISRELPNLLVSSKGRSLEDKSLSSFP